MVTRFLNWIQASRRRGGQRERGRERDRDGVSALTVNLAVVIHHSLLRTGLLFFVCFSRALAITDGHCYYEAVRSSSSSSSSNTTHVLAFIETSPKKSKFQANLSDAAATLTSNQGQCQ